MSQRVALPGPVGRADLPWVPTALGVGAVFGATVLLVEVPTFDAVLVRDVLVLCCGPLLLAHLLDRDVGLRLDRRAARNALLLTAFVLPFYVVGSTLPVVRDSYPLAPTTADASFLFHAAKVALFMFAIEVYFRGLLCVSIREVGPASILVSPLLYVPKHLGTSPIEVLLSGPADVLFGAVDYRSESILPSVLAHATGIVVLEWLVIHPPLVAPERVASWLRWLPVGI